jgi:CRP-like cAMP-binding protein
VELLKIDASVVRRTLAEDAGLAAAVNRALLRHTQALRAKIGIVSAGTVPRRLATLMLYLADRFGRPAEDAVLRIDVALTREQIGQLVSARVETVIRVLSRWQKLGWLRGTRDGLELLRRDMLERVLGL